MYLSIQISLWNNIRLTDQKGYKLDTTPNITCITVQEFRHSLLTIFTSQVILFTLLIIFFILSNIICADFFVYERLRFYLESKILNILRNILTRSHVIDDIRASRVNCVHQQQESISDLPPSYSSII